MHLARGTPVRSRFQLSPVTRGTSGFACPGSQKLHGFTRGAHLRRAARPVHALTAPSLNPAPSPTHVILRNSLPLRAGFIGQSHSRGPSPPPSSLRTRGLFPRRALPPASSVLQASPPPCRPGLPLAGFRLPRTRHRQGFPCCCAFHPPCMPAPLPRRKPAGPLAALFPAGRRPSPKYGRAGLPHSLFRGLPGVHLAFRPAWPLSRPGRPFCPECFSPCRYLHEPLWPLPAGATVAGRDSHPPGKRAFPRRTVHIFCTF